MGRSLTAERALVWNFLASLYCSDLVEGSYVGGETTVHAKNTAVHNLQRK